jgi:hypothetical protein
MARRFIGYNLSNFLQVLLAVATVIASVGFSANSRRKQDG